MTITSYIELYEPILRPASIPITALYNGVLNFLIWFHGTMPKAVADTGPNTIRTIKFLLQEDCGVFYDPRSYGT